MLLCGRHLVAAVTPGKSLLVSCMYRLSEHVLCSSDPRHRSWTDEVFTDAPLLSPMK